MGSKAFQILQLGAESTQFTPVAATTKFRGPGGTFTDNRNMVFPKEDAGIVGGTDRSYVPAVLAELETSETEVTFEQTPVVMNASVRSVAGVQDGVGTDYLYNYALHDTADPLYTDLKTYTAEYGDSVQYQRAAGMVCSEWEMKGKGESAWKFTSKWFGRQAANVTKTAGVALPTVEDALFQKTKVYLDAAGGSFGGTQLALSVLEANIKCTTGWYPIYTADGNLYYSIPGFDSEKYELTAELTMLVNTAVITERTNWESQVTRLLQLKTEGAALGTPGTTYSVKTMIQNYAGKFEMFNSLDNQNGTSIVKATFRNLYSVTKADRGNVLFVNELSALP